VQYLCDTPDGAWAEFLRHEEITEPEDLATIRRAIWAVELSEEASHEVKLPVKILTGGTQSYARCRTEARRLRRLGVTMIVVPSAALLPGAAHGWRVDGGLQPGRNRDAKVIVLFGRRPDIVGWAAATEGRPGEELLPLVRHLSP
jgi:hypothetical protein